MVINSLYLELQSPYRQHHSTETALLKVMNDVLLNMNSQQVTLMVLLDLSSAFDTVNHDILLERLDKDIGMRGVTLDWFRSYLSNRCQQVCANGSLSKQYHLNCGVPQGSCLDPLLFSMYTSTLFKVIERHLPKAHCYADDTQLYVSFKPGDAKAQDEAIRTMENCIEDLRNWLIEGRLLLNDDKTEFLVIGTRQQLNKLNPSVLHVGDDTIDLSVKSGTWELFSIIQLVWMLISDRSFYAAAPTLWNSLPLHIREITSLSVFKKQRKTYFFNIAYNR